MLPNATHNVNLWGCIFFLCSFTFMFNSLTQETLFANNASKTTGK
jgi:hypothetical protein